MEPELKELEEELRGFSPSPISGEVLSRMVQAMDRWQDFEDAESEAPRSEENFSKTESGSGKVIGFPVEKTGGGSGWKPMWAAAAAVAMLGAALGLILPSNPNSIVTAMNDLGKVPVLRQASLMPVNIKLNVRSLDTGVFSDRRGVEYQVIRIVREEEADFQGKDNVGLKITRPKVEHYLVPVSY